MRWLRNAWSDSKDLLDAILWNATLAVSVVVLYEMGDRVGLW